NEFDQPHHKMWRVSPQVYRHLESHPEIFEKMASFYYDIVEVAGDEFVERVFGCQVTPSFFEVFSIQPALGRVFQETEGGPGSEDVVVISHSLWQSRFGGDTEIIGQKLKTSDRTSTIRTFTIVGVMPSHFQFPLRRTRYWRPFQFTSELLKGSPGQGPNWWAIARLKAGVSREKAQAFLDTLSQHLAADSPKRWKGRIIRVRPLRDFFVDPELQKTLWTLIGAIGFILLIACANLANLQLARTESRLREVSVRMALGARRRHIVRQLLMEPVLLSSLGGLGGVLIAVWGVKILSLMVPSRSPSVRPVAIDQAMLLCGLTLSIATGIAFGLFPAWYACRIQLSESLKESGPVTSASASQQLFRNALVVGEVALAFFLLVGAALMIQSVMHVLRVNPGYDPTNLARINVIPRYGRVTSEELEERRSQLSALAERFAALPGTTATGLISDSFQLWDWQVQGQEEPIRLRVA
ncbi:MAG: ABC transporter permease, partial [Candidatus Hydrogenedentota bacterium]